MKTSAIICEYNPFHNGHKFQTDAARSITSCDTIVALMSGNFVQRGSFALLPKTIRAKAALSAGVDLVLENHTVSVLRSAEGYASSSVFTLSALGCVDCLVFGAETDDLPQLTKIAKLLVNESDDFKQMLYSHMTKGMTFAAARSRCIGNILGTASEEILKQPNNILAIEYLKAIIKQNSNIKPVLIPRVGVGHNSNTPKGSIASATYIRDIFACNPCKAFEFIPKSAIDLYKTCMYFKFDCADTAILAHLCKTKTEEIAKTPDISEGLENKIKAEAMKQNTLAELISAVKSKRYPYSRIRRALLCSYLGINKNDAVRNPEYIKILDFNKQGQVVLNTAKKISSLPLAKNASAILKNPSAMELWRRELEFDKIYNLFTSKK